MMRLSGSSLQISEIVLFRHIKPDKWMLKRDAFMVRMALTYNVYEWFHVSHIHYSPLLVSVSWHWLQTIWRGRKLQLL